MLPNLSLRLVTPADHPLIERLWQLYRHDLSEFRGTPLQPDGTFSIGRLPTFYDDPDRRAYLMYEDQLPVGFALIRGLLEERVVIGEYFVVRSARRRRIGQQAALALFAEHPGKWAIPFQEENAGAARFWRGVATSVAGDTWTEETRPIASGRPDLTPDVWILLDAKP